MTDYKKGLLYTSITVFCWGFLAIFLKLASRYIDSISIVWFRFIIAYILLSSIIFFKKGYSLKFQFKPPKIAIFAAIMLAGNYYGFMKGVELTTPSNAQIVIQFGPLTFAIIGILFFKERLNRYQMVGLLLAITGFIIFYKDQISTFLSNSTVYNMGIGFVFLGAISWALYATFQKIAVSKYKPQELNLVIYGIPALAFIYFVDFSSVLNFDLIAWALMIFLGINTLLAYGALGEAMKYLPANIISVLIILNPLITLFTMAVLEKMDVTWIDHERISLLGYIGAFWVLAGAMLVVAFKRGNNAKNN